MRHQPREFLTDGDAAIAQTAKCPHCGTVLEFVTNGMGRVLDWCACCDGGALPIIRRVEHARPLTSADRLETYVKDCCVCGAPFTTQHVHRVQCGRDYCQKENKRRKELAWRRAVNR